MDLGQSLGGCSHKPRGTWTPGSWRRQEGPCPGFLILAFRTGREVDFCGLETLCLGYLVMAVAGTSYNHCFSEEEPGDPLHQWSVSIIVRGHPAPLVKGQDALRGAACLTCCRSCR